VANLRKVIHEIRIPMGLRHPVSYIYTYNIICALHKCNKNISRARDAGHIYIHIYVTYILYIYMLRIYIYMCYIYYIHIIYIWQKQVRSKGRRTYLHLHYCICICIMKPPHMLCYLHHNKIAYGVASVNRID